MLAGVSAMYYSRLEQGLSTNASEAVTASIARALNLTPDERIHLFNLARPKANSPKRRNALKPEHIRPGTLRLIRSMPTTPAVVIGRRSEVLGWNSLGHRLVAGPLAFDSLEHVANRPNMTRMLFLDAHTRDLYAKWQDEAVRAMSSLRVLGGKSPEDHELTALVGELTVKSPEFAKLRAKHPVENCVSGVKYFRHPEVGDFELNFEVLTPPDESGHRVLMYAAKPGSTAEETLELLAHDVEGFHAERAPSVR